MQEENAYYQKTFSEISEECISEVWKNSFSKKKIVSRELENKDKYKWIMSMLNIIMSNIGGKKSRYN